MSYLLLVDKLESLTVGTLIKKPSNILTCQRSNQA
jgi:hypothetical protein